MPILEIVLALSALALGVLFLVRKGSRAGLVLAAASFAIVAGGVGSWQQRGDETMTASLPGARIESDYQSSDVCRACHPGDYHGWKDSFHRTMTQAVGPDTVLADWQGVELEDRGIELRLEREGEEFWAEFTSPFATPSDSATGKMQSVPMLRARVVMSTGSHHLQNYWVRPDGEEGNSEGALVQLPFVWLIEEARWIPLQDSFLTPPSPEPEPLAVWNRSCHLCHSVAPAPGYSEEGFDTTTAELGVACEACHGPAREHVAAFQNPVRRYAARSISPEIDERGARIVQPARLGQDRSVEACGQCHSFSRPVDLAKWKKDGIGYHPGDPLSPVKALLRYSESPSDPHLLAQLAEEPNALLGRFWSDGTIRVAGREMNGLVESACFERGDMTCLSCHSMHGYEEANDQLRPGARGNGPCLECHAEFKDSPTSHTRHAPDSPGSECQNCHMPYTTYGLFKAIRSHRIDSPRVVRSAGGGRPNACNLCHLDKTLSWTDRKLVRGWRTQPALDSAADPNGEVAAGIVWALSGDAAQRALVAWHFGWEPAWAAAGPEWMSLYLGQLLSDPYASIRHVAGKSIARHRGFDEFEYDFLAKPGEQTEKSQEAWARWQESVRTNRLIGRRELLFLDDGRLDRAGFARLLGARDQTPIRIIE